MPGWLKSLLTLSSSDKTYKPNQVRGLCGVFHFSLPVVLVLFHLRAIRKSGQRAPARGQERAEKKGGYVAKSGDGANGSSHALQEVAVKKDEGQLEARASLEDSGVEQTAEILYQKKFHEALTANSPLAIVALDLDHHITSCNPEFEALFGYTQTEVTGLALDELITNEDTRKEAVGFSNQVSLGHKIHATGQRRKKDGSLVEVEIFGVPVIVDEKQVGILGLYNDITERQHANDALKEQHKFFSEAIESLTHPFYVVDARDYTIQISNLTARQDHPGGGRACYTMTHSAEQPCHGPEHTCPLEEVRKTRRPAIAQHIHSGPDGETRFIEVHGYPLLNEQGELVKMIEYNLDVTQRRQAEEALRAAKERAEQLYRVVPSAIITVDTNRRITSINAKAVEMIGYEPEELIGKPCTLFATGSCNKRCGLYASSIPKPIMGAECTIRNRAGELRTVIKNADLLHNAEGYIIGGVESFEDISDRKRAEEGLKYLATHDPLTGLPNRMLFYDRLRQALLMSQRGHQRVTVMFLDLDGFKAVNDSLGHENGDRLLQSMADRLKKTLRKSDTVARLGGDEFGFLFENITNPADVTHVARKILIALRKPILLDPSEISVTASIGISLAPEDGQDAESLIKSADTAMYLAKEAGKNNFQFFSKMEFSEEPNPADGLISGIRRRKGY